VESILEAIGNTPLVKLLAQEDGIFAGISTGANVVGAHRLAERLGSDAVIVTLAVDSGLPRSGNERRLREHVLRSRRVSREGDAGDRALLGLASAPSSGLV
jgi:hypothetical protein